MVKIYPFEVPDVVHPMTPYLLGHGLSAGQIQRLCKTFDGLGIRFHYVEPHEVTYSWAVSWPRDPDGRTVAEIGDVLNLALTDVSAVRITGGSLPPGIRLDKARGKLSGVFTHGGLYSVTVTIGAAIKYDPMGSPGGPDDPGQWIDIDQPRTLPPAAPIPGTLEELSPQELEQIIVQAQEAQRAQLIRRADGN